MANYALHACLRHVRTEDGGLGQVTTDEDGRTLVPLMVTCGTCDRSWCERCDPAPSALCHYCHGYGYSKAAIPPRQARALRRR